MSFGKSITVRTLTDGIALTLEISANNKQALWYNKEGVAKEAYVNDSNGNVSDADVDAVLSNIVSLSGLNEQEFQDFVNMCLTYPSCERIRFTIPDDSTP